MNKIVIAIDSFKGSVSSREACSAAAKAVKNIFPECEVVEIPVADGGEGFAEIMALYLNASPIIISVNDPLMRSIETIYFLNQESKTAIIESAAACGLSLIPKRLRNPFKTSSFGLGEMILDAIGKGAENIIVGLGGSATNDGGMGMLRALGYEFYDTDGAMVPAKGENLIRVNKIIRSKLYPQLSRINFIIASDVKNKLYGDSGATRVYAAQKGATPQSIEVLEHGMKHFASVVHRNGYPASHEIPGSGAAGGLGGALYSFLNGKFYSGAELILNTCNFNKYIEDADLIITGEGCIDAQTINGKISFEVLERGKLNSIPVIAISGCIKDYKSIKDIGFLTIQSILNNIQNIDDQLNINNTKDNIITTVIELMKIIKFYRGN